MGLRNGSMLQLTAAAQVTAAAQAPQLQPLLPQLQLAAIKEMGSLPVVLIPLPTAVGLVGVSLALSDRMALLSSAPGTGRAVASPLAVAGVTHAVPLWQQPASSVSSNSISRQDSTAGWSLDLLFHACAVFCLYPVLACIHCVPVFSACLFPIKIEAVSVVACLLL